MEKNIINIMVNEPFGKLAQKNNGSKRDSMDQSRPDRYCPTLHLYFSLSRNGIIPLGGSAGSSFCASTFCITERNNKSSGLIILIIKLLISPLSKNKILLIQCQKVWTKIRRNQFFLFVTSLNFFLLLETKLKEMQTIMRKSIKIIKKS
jgi:hypothetical protein